MWRAPSKRTQSSACSHGNCAFLQPLDMSQFWSADKAGVAYPPVKPRKEYTQRARPISTRVTELLGIE